MVLNAELENNLKIFLSAINFEWIGIEISTNLKA